MRKPVRLLSLLLITASFLGACSHKEKAEEIPLAPETSLEAATEPAMTPAPESAPVKKTKKMKKKSSKKTSKKSVTK